MRDPVDPRFASVPTLFFVIGAQKAGTTWLHQFLNSHPEVNVPALKETNYWRAVEEPGAMGERLRQEADQRRNESIGQRWLRPLLPGRQRKYDRSVTHLLRAHAAPGAPHTAYASALFQSRGRRTRAVGEVCPQYALLSTETYAAMSALAERVRFVYLLRDPVERLISGFRHRLRAVRGAGGFNQSHLDAKVDAALAGRVTHALRLSRYDMAMDRLEAAVPRGDILYLFYEDLFDQTVIDGLCTFLGIGHHAARVDRVVHKGAGGDFEVSVEHRRGLADLLVPTHDRVHGMFDGALPEAWMRSWALTRQGDGVSA